MIRIRIEDVPSAYRQIYAAEAITRCGVENRLRSVGLAARVAVSRLRGGEFPVIGAPPQRVKITRGIVGCQGPAPVRAFLLDRDAGHDIEQSRLGRGRQDCRKRIDPGDFVFRVTDAGRDTDLPGTTNRDAPIAGQVDSLGSSVETIREVLQS